MLRRRRIPAQNQQQRPPVQRAVDGQIVEAALDRTDKEPVAPIQQCKIQTVARRQRAVQAGVILDAAGGYVARHLLGLHAVQCHDRQSHRVDRLRHLTYLAPVTLGIPAVCPLGSICAVIVKERRDGVVKAVDVIVGDARRRLCRSSELRQQQQHDDDYRPHPLYRSMTPLPARRSPSYHAANCPAAMPRCGVSKSMYSPSASAISSACCNGCR